MPLESSTAAPVVDGWVQASATSWSAAQKARLTALLVDLSAAVVPHVVVDVPIDPGRLQNYHMQRVIARLDNWLSSTAATLRMAYGWTAPRLRREGAALAVGVRSATVTELDGLPGLGPVLAQEVAKYVARHPEIRDLSPLADIDGIGPGRVETLSGVAYVDSPRLVLMSPALRAFVDAPSVTTVLPVLTRTDLALAYGDETTLLRRISAQAVTTPAERFLDFVQLVLDHSSRASRLVDGVTASDAERWLRRREIRAALLQRAQDGSGGVLINAAYVTAATQLMDAATTAIRLMVFLGTATDSDTDGPGSLQLVERIEAAAVRGVQVRVVLDQDDGGVPYRSYFINRPLFDRLKARGIAVKFDEKDTLLHSKVLTADRAAVIVGSHNWTRAGLSDTHELSLLHRSQALVDDFNQRFDTLWDSLPVP